jgi:hypothetical protein
MSSTLLEWLHAIEPVGDRSLDSAAGSRKIVSGGVDPGDGPGSEF